MSFPPDPPLRDGFELPRQPQPVDVWPVHEWTPRPAPRPSAWLRWGRNLLLFVLTSLSVFLTGLYPYGTVGGLQLMVGMMSILLAHEMGHYLACRYYKVDATLPFFLPAPIINPLVGTFGAVIRIKSPFPHRRALFDIGIAGPLAGFVVCLPVMILGVQQMQVVPMPKEVPELMASPLALDLATTWLKGDVPDTQILILGPLGMAAWFGLLVTALNLIPIGQLDGGHVTYALFRRRALMLSQLAWWACVAMIVVVGPSWLLWAIVVRVLGMWHPPTLDDDAGIGTGRMIVAAIGVAVFVLCFVPNPFYLTWPRFIDAWRELGHALLAWLT